MPRFLSLLGVVFWLTSALAQQPGGAGEDDGNLLVSRSHAAWPTPEAVVRDLLSSDDAVRLKAMEAMEVGPLSHRTVYSKDGKTSEQVVSTPDQVGVRYAALGEDDTRQAVVTMSLLGVYVYAAIAVPRSGGWQRIATLSCWCKYEQNDVLQNFISLDSSPLYKGKILRYELAARGSGGGTGLYSQEEARFRVYRGELKRVMYFESGYRSCPPGPEPRFCLLRAKWFQDGVLFEARGKIRQDRPEVYFRSREVEDEALRLVHCTAYQWDDTAFSYSRLPGEAQQCKPDLGR